MLRNYLASTPPIYQNEMQKDIAEYMEENKEDIRASIRKHGSNHTLHHLVDLFPKEWKDTYSSVRILDNVHA